MLISFNDMDVCDLTSVFQAWNTTGLTESFKRSSKNKPFEQNKDVDELIKTMRKNRPIDPPQGWSSRNRRWWNAVSLNKFNEISQLLIEDSTLIRWKNPFDGTALHYAAKNGNLRSLDLLVKQYRADVNAQSKGSTPLHIAIKFSQRLFIRCLLEVYRARTDIMDYAGRFPLHLLSPELAPEFQTVLSSGRLGRIRDSLSILIPKPQSTSWNSIMSATNTIHRLAGKYAFSKHNYEVAQHSLVSHLLLSALPSANGDSCQPPMQNVIHRLRHGLPLQLSVPTGDENVRPSTAASSSKSKAGTLRVKSRRLSHTSSLRSITNSWATMRQPSQQQLPPPQPPPPQESRTLTFPRTSSMGPETSTADARRHTLLLSPSSSLSLYKKSTLSRDVSPSSAGATADSSNAKFAVPRKMSVFRRRRIKKGSAAGTGSGAALDSLLPPVPRSDGKRARSVCLLSRQSSVSTSSDLGKSPSDSSFSGFDSSVEPPDLLTGCLEAVANRPQLSLFAVPPPSEHV